MSYQDAKRHPAAAQHGASSPEIPHPPLHLVRQTAALIAADLLGQPKDEDRQLVALRLVELLVRANAHRSCPPPADDAEAQEREHLGCAYCGTGIYNAAASTGN